MKPGYRRMLNGMTSAGAADWSVYILRCSDGTYYTGIAKDVEGRLAKHNAGKGSAYVRTRRPAEVIHRESPFTRAEALVREARIKALPRGGKERLVIQGRRRERPGPKTNKVKSKGHSPGSLPAPPQGPRRKRGRRS